MADELNQYGNFASNTLVWFLVIGLIMLADDVSSGHQRVL